MYAYGLELYVRHVIETFVLAQECRSGDDLTAKLVGECHDADDADKLTKCSSLFAGTHFDSVTSLGTII